MSYDQGTSMSPSFLIVKLFVFILSLTETVKDSFLRLGWSGKHCNNDSIGHRRLFIPQV